MTTNRQAGLLSAVVALLCLAGTAEAKQPPVSLGLERVADGPEAFERTGQSRVSAETGAPLALYRVGYKASQGPPLAMARQYLRDNAKLLRLGFPDLGDLQHRITSRGRASDTVRFVQTYQGVPVYQSEVAVTINRARREVTFVMNGYKPGIALPGVNPSMTSAAARDAALRYLGAQGAPAFETTDLVVYHRKGQGRLAWRVRIEPRGEPLGSWEILADAGSGEVFRAEDRSAYGGTPVNGTGQAFEPDPLSSAHANYGTGGFVDAADADSADLTGELASVTLRDIDLTGGIHTLKGPWAEIVDFESPFKGLFTQPSSTFNFTRSPDAFEAVNTYHDIDTMMRWLNDPIPGGLALNIEPFQYPGGVQFDPHGLSGADNSHYLPASGRLAFGEGGVDDAEDADVVIHELGHGLHDWVTGGSLSQVQGLSEGSGDYIAASYSRSFNQWLPGDPQYFWVFDWDGHNPFWPGRVTNHPAHYPEGLTGQIHTDGQIWATALMRIWNLIGRAQTDTAFFEGLRMTTSSTNQEDAAQAVVQAAFDLGYTPADQAAILNEFQITGYDVVPVPVELQGFSVE